MNKNVAARLKAIQQSLVSHHAGGSGMPNAVAGTEREHLINEYLKKVLPATYRWGSGAITDQDGNLSGQLDVIVELPFYLSFPMPTGTERLYLAESVAAVIEVKSNLSRQWNEVESTVRKVRRLRRDVSKVQAVIPEFSIEPSGKIPCYVVGYVGYSTIAGLRERLEATSQDSRADGALVIQSGCFVGQKREAEGVWGLYCFVAELLLNFRSIVSAHSNPYLYGP